MSHNSKSYRKKIKLSTVNGCKKIDILFKQNSLRQCETIALDTPGKSADAGVTSHIYKSVPETKSAALSSSLASDTAVSASADICTEESSSSEYESDCNSVNMVPDARKFSSAKYEARFDWLYYSVSKGGYCCKICELFCPNLLHNNSINPFVNGVKLGQHPTRKLNAHSSSKTHVEACQREARARSSIMKIPRVKSMLLHGSEKQHNQEVARNRDYFTVLIKTVFFVIRKRWALDSVSDVMGHMTAVGNEAITQYSQYHPDTLYTSPQSISEIVNSINCVLESETLEQLREADMYTLLADESSDDSHREQFAIIVRFKNNGKVGDYFLGIVEVKRTDAASIMTAIEDFLRSKDVDITKAVFVGFDGCNTMSGENKGLQRRFRHLVPHQLYINCRNHKLALCVKHLIKEFPAIDAVDGILIGVWKLFNYSPKKFATFKDVQESYGLTKLTMIRACTTRWLSHGTACQRLTDRYVQVIDTLDACLEEKYDADVHGVRLQLLNKKNTATILVLCDVLQPLLVFSAYLQGSNIFSDVMVRCKSLIEELHQLIGRFQMCMVTPDESLKVTKLTEYFAEIDERAEFARRLRDDALMYTPRQAIDEIAIPVTYFFINEISDAFHCAPVLDGFSVFNMENVPSNMHDMATYGTTQINALSTHYGKTKEDVFQGHRTVAAPKYSEEAYRAQFTQFKHQLCLMKQRAEGGDVFQLFTDPIYVTSFPAVYHLVSLSELIPSSTASVERLFSLMNALCTPSRNRLCQEKLDSLIRLCMHDKELTVPEISKIIDKFNEKERDIAL